MTNDTLKFFIVDNPSMLNIGMHIVHDSAAGSRSYAEPLTLITDAPDAAVYHPPALELSHEDMQALADTLWTKGYRPSLRVQDPHVDQTAALGDHIATLKDEDYVRVPFALYIKLTELLGNSVEAIE